METTKRFFPLAALAGLLAGCAAMWLVWSRGTAPAKTSAPDSLATASQAQPQIQTAGKSPEADSQTAQTQPVPRGAEARRYLDEIKRDKAASASVNVRFFNSPYSGKITQQFIDFFELTPDEVSELSDLIQTTRKEMWKAANAQAQVTQTATGGVVVKIPPATAGPDIYDKVMNGFQSVLGDDRFKDMMLYNDGMFGGQFEELFHQFGGEEATVTIEPTDNGHYNLVVKRTLGGSENGAFSIGTYNDWTADEIKNTYPEYQDFIPAK